MIQDNRRTWSETARFLLAARRRGTGSGPPAPADVVCFLIFKFVRHHNVLIHMTSPSKPKKDWGNRSGA
jgi:hypothetical protein